MRNVELRTKNKGLCAQWLLTLILLASLTTVSAQQYTGMSGLIHVPSADMDKAGEIRIGAHFLNKESTPDRGFNYEGKYNTLSHYLSITPFSWMEIGYTCTLQKGKAINIDGKVQEGTPRLRFKDRYFSIKIQPLKEDKWWPSIAIGSNDPYGTSGTTGTGKEAEKTINGDGLSQYFGNFYIAATKHFSMQSHTVGVHLSYRKWKRSYNNKWNGPVGGITYQPSFQKNLRLIIEYTGNEVNVGFDWKLWRHLLIQSSLQNGKYFSGGLCYQLNLL